MGRLLPRAREAPLRDDTCRGERLLDHWAEALRRSQERTARFLARYEERR